MGGLGPQINAMGTSALTRFTQLANRFVTLEAYLCVACSTAAARTTPRPCLRSSKRCCIRAQLVKQIYYRKF